MSRACTTQQHIARLEKGERELTISWLKRLADAMECHPSDLLPDGLGLSPRGRSFALMFEKLSTEKQDELFKICDAINAPMNENLKKAVDG